jgi:thiol-disulfide isomerase/thioredoxin
MTQKHLTILLVFFALSIQGCCFAQDDIVPPYLKSGKWPTFNLRLMPDSSSFTHQQLTKNSKVIFIMFSPDCGHCKVFAQQLADSAAMLSNRLVLLFSSLDFSRIRSFYDEYKFERFPFIKVARDAAYHLPQYFATRQFPTAYVYDRNGKFQRKIEGEISIAELAAEK